MHSMTRVILGMKVEYHHPIAEAEASDSAQATLPSISVMLPEDHELHTIGFGRHEELLGHNIAHYIRHEGTMCWMLPDCLQIYYRLSWLEGLNDEERTDAIWAEAAYIIHQIQRITTEWWSRVSEAKRALASILEEIGQPPL